MLVNRPYNSALPQFAGVQILSPKAQRKVCLDYGFALEAQEILSQWIRLDNGLVAVFTKDDEARATAIADSDLNPEEKLAAYKALIVEIQDRDGVPEKDRFVATA